MGSNLLSDNFKYKSDDGVPMVKNHKVQVNFYIRDKDIKDGIGFCNVEYWQNSNKNNLIKFLKARANDKHAYKILIFNDSMRIRYVKHKTLWFKE